MACWGVICKASVSTSSLSFSPCGEYDFEALLRLLPLRGSVSSPLCRCRSLSLFLSLLLPLMLLLLLPGL
jgi:hypothetical protein